LAKEITNIIEFTLIYNRHKAKLFNFVKKMVNSSSAAEDIIQAVFLKFYENMNNIKSRDAFEFWLFKCARNEVYNSYRSKKVKSEIFEAVDFEAIPLKDTESAEYLFDQKEMHTLIMKELNTYPLEQREAYLLKEYCGLSYKEIAELTNTDEDLIKSRLFKVRRKLVEKISKIVLFGINEK